nr:transketolase family protein [uncultured Peptostreptococcus sp.]
MSSSSMREAFGRALVDIGDKSENIIVVDADLSKSTKTEYFKTAFPSRFVDVGIAEQNLLGVSAGLASTGKTVFASSFAVFETGRAYEVIRNTVCIGNLNVKLCASHAGLMTGPDGATHQSLEDIASMRVLPNMKVLVPADAIEAASMTKFMANDKGPTYMRLVRDDTEDINDENYIFELGKGRVLREGRDISILACGPMVKKALDAAVQLEETGISARVVNMSTIKPIDVDLIVSSARQTRGIITVEDHSIFGGLGSSVAEVIVEKCPVKMKIIGVNDSFGMSGRSNDLYRHFGLTSERIVNEAINILDKV